MDDVLAQPPAMLKMLDLGNELARRYQTQYGDVTSKVMKIGGKGSHHIQAGKEN